MPIDVPLLSVVIADTGLVVETSRMHRKRPMRTPSRSYLHLEAFELMAGEAVELRLRPLEARAEPDVPPSAASRAAEQRESVLTAIRGIDEDFEIGKLSETDHREMRLTLHAEAVNWLRVERAALAEAAQTESSTLAEAAETESAMPAGAAKTDGTPKSCPSCKTAIGANARFCSQCGAPLDRGEPADEAPLV